MYFDLEDNNISIKCIVSLHQYFVLAERYEEEITESTAKYSIIYSITMYDFFLSQFPEFGVQ